MVRRTSVRAQPPRCVVPRRRSMRRRQGRPAGNPSASMIVFRAAGALTSREEPTAANREGRDTLQVVARLERLREFVDRLHPSGLLYATYEHRLIAELDHSRLPRHVAVLADGNRRWARDNAPGQPLVTGYHAGARKLREFVEWCDEIGIPVVTLWVLSTDNFSRSSAEELEPLLEVIEAMVADLAATRRWQLHPFGALDLPGLVVNIAVSYGGRHELRDAVRSLLEEHARNGTPVEEIARTLDIDHIA